MEILRHFPAYARSVWRWCKNRQDDVLDFGVGALQSAAGSQEVDAPNGNQAAASAGAAFASIVSAIVDAL
jgi:hypothetical protein